MAYSFEQLKEAMDKNHSTRQDFLKTLLTIASTMLAILAAFTSSGKTESLTLNVMFLTTLALLSIGILAGGITLYFDTVAAKTIFVQMKEVLLKQIKSEELVSSIASYNPPKFFYICEKICYISLLLSVISLAFYTGLKTII